ncbi:MAG TPA: DUF983 domain-containing protein [Xanthobacteraceae bacterium]
MTTSREPVSLSRALWRGLRMRCPNCGQASLFGRFLKVVDHCPACGEEYSHHRADDFPPYLVIVVLGHLVVPLILAVEVAYAPPIWLQYLIWLPLVAVGTVALLQPTKGAVVALQWQLGLDDFEPAKKRRALAAQADCGRLAEVAR